MKQKAISNDANQIGSTNKQLRSNQGQHLSDFNHKIVDVWTLFPFFCWANVSSDCSYCLKIAILKWKSGRETERQKERECISADT